MSSRSSSASWASASSRNSRPRTDAEREQLAAVGREPTQALADDRAHARRDAAARRPASPRRPSASSSRTTSATKSALPSVSAWIAATSSSGGRVAGRELDVLGDVALAQAVERDLARVRLAHELGEGGRQRVAERRVDVAVGADDQAGGCPRSRARRSAAAGATARRRRGRRRGRRPAAVTRPRAAGRSRPPRRAGSGRRRLSSAGTWQVREQLASSGSSARGIAVGRAQLGASDSALAVAHVGAQRLDPRPVRRGAARLPAAADQDPGAAGPRAAGELVGQPALADAGLARDEQDAAAARRARRLSASSSEVGELARAAHEHPAGRCRARAPRRGAARSSSSSWPRIA